MRDPRQGAGAGLGQLGLVERGLACAAVADQRQAPNAISPPGPNIRITRPPPSAAVAAAPTEAGGLRPRAEFRRGRQGSYRAPGLNHSISLEALYHGPRCC